MGVTVYNLAKDTSFCVGDTVAISDPLLSHIHLQEKVHIHTHTHELKNAILFF